jgi:hypothetical protein
VYLPEMVEREVDWMLGWPEAAAVFCADVFVDAEGREIGRLDLPAEVRGEQPLEYATVLNALLTHTNTFLRCPSALVRASVYRELGGYDEEFKNTADIEMWLRIVRAYPIGILEQHLLRYRRGHGSSSERYHQVRTEPFRFFRIFDLELEAGARQVATARALHAYEAHRAEDTLMRAVNYYILGERRGARAALADLRLDRLLRSGRVQRGRLLILALALHVLARAPHVAAIARLFRRRWHSGAPSKLVVHG